MKVTKEEIKNFLKGRMNTEEKMSKIANAKHQCDSERNYQSKKELVNNIYQICNN